MDTTSKPSSIPSANPTTPVAAKPAAPPVAPTPPEIKSVSSATPIVPRVSNDAKDTDTNVQVTKIVKDPAPDPTDKPAASTVVVPKPTLGDLLERFVQVETLPDPSSQFTHRGVCKKCGWQSYQLSDEAARQLVRVHVGAHWRDVSQELPR